MTGEATFLRLFGLGMATAILVDATVVRMVLVPAVMPSGAPTGGGQGWLDRLVPRLDHEARVDAPLPATYH